MLSQNSSLGAGTAVAPDVVLLKRAVLAFRSGDKDIARDLLAEAAEHNPDNELVWLWTASAARTRKEALNAVQKVLALNPTNEKALQWIEKLQPAGAAAAAAAAGATPSSNGVAAGHVADNQAEAREGQSEEAHETVREAAETTTAVEQVEEEERVEAEQSAEEVAEATPREESATVVEGAASESAVEDRSAEPVEEERQSIVEEVEEEETASQEAASSDDDAESRLAALEADIDGDVQSALEESVEEAQAVEEEEDETARQEASFEPIREAAPREEEESQDPLMELLGAKPKKAEEKREEDIWAALGMAGMQEARPALSEPAREEVETPAEARTEEKVEGADAGVPVQTAHDEVEEDESCFICEKLAKPQEGLCSACRAIVDLSLMDLAPRHEGADRVQLSDALERVREKIEDAPTAKLYIQAALICLNMRQSQQARSFLREAVRLRPHDRELVGYYDQLEKRPLILAVDDSKTVQKMISTVLEKESYRVVQAEDGLGAIAKLDEELPKLVLLDITMPRMDGYQVCKVITGNEATKHIPVIMLSGKDGFFDKVRGKMVGASNYITKPFDPSELTKTIAKFLKN